MRLNVRQTQNTATGKTSSFSEKRISGSLHSQNGENPLSASLCMSVCSYGTTRPPPDGFLWNLILKIFLKSAEKIQACLKYSKAEGCFTRRPVYIYDSISLNCSQNEKCFTQTLYRTQHIHFMLKFFFSENNVTYEIRSKIMPQPDSTQMSISYDAKTMRFACRITKGRMQTSTHKFYVFWTVHCDIPM